MAIIAKVPGGTRRGRDQTGSKIARREGGAVASLAIHLPVMFFASSFYNFTRRNDERKQRSEKWEKIIVKEIDCGCVIKHQEERESFK